MHALIDGDAGKGLPGAAQRQLIVHAIVWIILLGFILAFAIRAAVGSGTAAMLAAVAIAGPACVETGLSPVVAGMSICLGATAGTLPTDVTFWFPERMNDLSSKDCTLTTFVPSLLAALVGFVILLIINACSGFLPGLY